MRAHRAPVVVTAPLAVVVLGLALTACSGSSSGNGSSASAPSSPSAATTEASASPSPSPSAFTSTCDDALSLVAVGTAAGQPIVGDTAFVVGEADPSIGRVAYLNCRYGLPAAADPAAPAPATPAAAAVPSVEIGVSLYETDTRAADRVAGTVSEYRTTGATATATPVGDASGTLLETPGEPRTLVVAAGRRTVAVTMTDAVYTGSGQIAAVAALALQAVT